jgi:AraC family transcriptional regulator of adaptative response/methylated-DNA-[protein]-cysteine methyltransferase
MQPPFDTTFVNRSARYLNDHQRWNAIRQRDAEADGHFVYSVKTTGIYCRPSCGSKLPLRLNVDFHVSCAAAERAGFRACRRCQPAGPTRDEQHAAVVAKACRILQATEEIPKLATLAAAVGLSPFHFHRLFTETLGVTPKAYASAQRAERVRKALAQGQPVTRAIYEAGYNSNSRFYAKSAEMIGMLPSQFRNGGAGARVQFAVGQCSLGEVLVAASAKGVCAIFLGDDPNKLVEHLQDQFPNADLVGGDRDFERVVAQVIGMIEKPRVRSRLPLDVRGTAFQQKVWQALRRIPPGRTASYAEIARRIRMPKAVRAVARACAANAIAVAIPCHRVVRTDGSLSGYRWGVERKRALLKREETKR